MASSSSSLIRKAEADCRKQDRIDAFFESIYAGSYDNALRLVQHNPELAVTRYVNDETALHALAKNPSAYATRNRGFLRKVVNFFIENSDIPASNQALELLQFVWIEVIRRQEDINVADFIRQPTDLLFNAAKLGDVELLAVLLRPCPVLVGEVDEDHRSIFHVAVQHRQVKTLSLIDEIGLNEEYLLATVDNEKNNILHLAAKFGRVSSHMVGPEAVTKMQQELLSFKEVETRLPPSLREMENGEGLTPSELFSIEHKRLLRRAQQQMSIIAWWGTSFMLFFSSSPWVFPRIINKTILHSYATLFVSTCFCVMMCLWILKSSHEENNFLVSSPLKYMGGVLACYTTLMSLAASFSTSIYINLQSDTSSWVFWLSQLPLPVVVTFWIAHLLPIRGIFYASYRGWYLSHARKH